jgi:hypothetical protein
MFSIHFVLVYMELCFVYMLILYGWKLKSFYWLLVGLELGKNNMEVFFVGNWATIPLT